MKIFAYIFYALLLTIIFKIGSLIIGKRYKEPSFVGFRARRPVEALKIVKIIAVVGFIGVILFFGLHAWGSEIYVDDFEIGYDLGNLGTQNNWLGAGYWNDFQVSTDVPHTGSIGLYYTSRWPSGGDRSEKKETGITPLTDGVFSGWLRVQDHDHSQNFITILNENAYETITGFGIYNGNFAGLIEGYVWQVISGDVSNDTWYHIKIEWRSSDHKVRFSHSTDESENWSDWYVPYKNFAVDVKGVGLYGFNWDTNYKTAYFDDLGVVAEVPEPEFRIWGITPESSTEITATSTNFTFGYEGFATSTEGFMGWSGIIVDFCEETTGICADERKYPKSELSGTSGQKTLSFDNFNFDANGHWDLIGGAYVGAFSPDWEWVEVYLGNSVSPDYYVMVNFAGLPEIFHTEVPATWYTEHTEYATSTAFFSSITGILTPLFSKIGEFGSRITGFFNQQEAYSRGKNIGAILPTFKLYIAQFSFLFGGFPIIETFILAMVVMVGFFLFKLVFRLIRG
jgi:hypothetical protein